MPPAVDGHDAEHRRVAPRRVELGHVLEVHPVDGGDEGERDEDRGDDGEDLHHLVQPLVLRGEEDLHHRHRHLPQGLDELQRLDRVVVDVAQEDPRLGGDQRRLVAQQGGDLLAHRPHRPPDEDEVVPQPLQAHQRVVGRASVERLVFERVDPLAQLVHHREVGVHHRVDEQVGEVVGAHLAHAAPALADRLPQRAEAVAVGALLDGHDPVGAEEHADLLVLDGGRPGLPLVRAARSRIVRMTTNTCLSKRSTFGRCGTLRTSSRASGCRPSRSPSRATTRGIAEAVDVDPRDRAWPEAASASSMRGDLLRFGPARGRRS